MSGIYKVVSPIAIGNYNLSLKCPHCLENGSFLHFSVSDISSNDSTVAFGQRKCPNKKCQGLVFVMIDKPTASIIRTYPQQLIPFDKSRIPDRIIKAFEEALTCHSISCYTASAIMIRKTLEEIAEEKGIIADNLYKRLKLLGETIVVPKELIEAMQELRLLGNDAAHIESKTYEEVGKTEIEISIEFTKEILKATYQYEDLLSKLRSLKKDNQVSNADLPA